MVHAAIINSASRPRPLFLSNDRLCRSRRGVAEAVLESSRTTYRPVRPSSPVYTSGVPIPKVPKLTEASEYAGQAAVHVACTQLGSRYTTTQARRVVAEWVDLLSGERTAISDLQFLTRTPKRLFSALSGQTQLRRLVVKWGDYDDLAPLEDLQELECLELGGASAVTQVGPLATLDKLKTLAIEGFRRIDDTTPLGHLVNLTDLELGGDWISPRNAHVSSIAFLRELNKLEKVLLHTLFVDDRDYSALLSLPRLSWVRVMATKGMEPSFDRLKRALPWVS